MATNLPLNVQVDDSNPAISYSAGDWQEETGSSRQFDSDVHLTSNYGATISFRYNAEALVLYGTIPAGSGNVIFDVSIDGGGPTSLTKACTSEDQFEVDLFESPVMEFTVHTAIITNRGRSTDAYGKPQALTTSTSIPTTFQELPQSVPSPTSPSTHVSQISSSSSSSSSSTTTTTTSTTSSTTTTSASSSSETSTESASVSNSSASATTTSESITTFLSTDSRGSTVLFTHTFITSFPASSQTGSAAAIASPSHIGTAMAGGFGGLAILLLVIVAILVTRRRRKRTRALLQEDKRGLILKKPRNVKPSIMPRPFSLSTLSNLADTGTSSTSNQLPAILEKLGYRNYNAPNVDHNAERDATTGPSNSSANQVPSDAPLNQNPHRVISSAAQFELSTNILSHRRHATIVNADDGEITAHSPQTISPMSSASENTHDAPPAYQPSITGTRMLDFETSPQIYNDHTSGPPEDAE